mgnify:FL=1|jgi:hypothetical protein|nr:MAG TPA: hypothetical protein [Bacteriophage sp.]
MKIILIAILILLLINTIRNLPKNLSKKEIEKRIAKNRQVFAEKDEPERSTLYLATLFIGWVFYIVLGIIYAKLGMRFADNNFALILSIIEVVICIINIFNYSSYATKLEKDEEFSVNRFRTLLFSMVDIVYYPTMIWLLIQSF